MQTTIFDKNILIHAILAAVKKTNPIQLRGSAVILITWIGALLSSVATIENVLSHRPFGFEVQISLWLWFTVLFSNFSEALAEGRGKAQAESLKKTRTQTVATQL